MPAGLLTDKTDPEAAVRFCKVCPMLIPAMNGRSAHKETPLRGLSNGGQFVFAIFVCVFVTTGGIIFRRLLSIIPGDAMYWRIMSSFTAGRENLMLANSGVKGRTVKAITTQQNCAPHEGKMTETPITDLLPNEAPIS